MNKTLPAEQCWRSAIDDDLTAPVEDLSGSVEDLSPPVSSPLVSAPHGPRHVRKQPLRRRPLFWILPIFLVLAGASVPIVKDVSGQARHAPVAPRKLTMTYSVVGSGTPAVSSITFRTQQEGDGSSLEVQDVGATLPWKRTVVTSDPRNPSSLSVENGSVVLSYVVCSISEDGRVLSSDKAKGPYAVASCRGAPSSGRH
jgi:hypothetical protein